MHTRSTVPDGTDGTTIRRRWPRRSPAGCAGVGGVVARAGALGAALALVTAAAAGAHPVLRPGEVPNGSATEAEIVIPHGCGAEGGVPEDDADPSPTTQVSLQWPDGVEVIPGEVDGWTTSVDDGVTTWDDDGGATTEPIVLPVSVQVTAEVVPGAVDVSVHQECANGESFRWQAGPDEEGSPALRMTVVAGAPEDDDPAGTPTAAAPTATPSPVATPDPTSDTTSDVTPPAVTETPAASATASPTGAAAGDDESDGGMPWWVPVVAVAVVLLVALPFVNRDRNPRRDGGGGA